MSDMTFNPLLSSTEISLDGHEWRPTTFQNFLKELHHITAYKEAFLFRGQRISNRLLDSRFARKIKEQEGLLLTDRYSEKILTCVKTQHKFANSLLNQINNVPILFQQQKASKAMLVNGNPIDLLYEYHKHIQQNPDDPAVSRYFPFGTNCVDFSYSWKVGLYFANDKRIDEQDGSLFIVHQKNMGKVFSTGETPFQDAIHSLRKHVNEFPLLEYERLPLFVWPKYHVNNELDPKPKLQDVVYLMQMDFRYDFGLSWQQLYQETGNQVFIKLILPKGTCKEVEVFLTNEGITKEYLFPVTKFDRPEK